MSILHHLPGFGVYIGQVAVQRAFQKHKVKQVGAMFPEELPPQFAVFSNGPGVAFGENQIGNQIAVDLGVSQFHGVPPSAFLSVLVVAAFMLPGV